uniref:Phosphoribosylformylglycinamidine synthase n=1 Tax=Entomoneis paludosa TaxID=265537 RepID=A0A6U2ZF31_9STRA
MPQKTFVDSHVETKCNALSFPDDTTATTALDRVLRLLSVGSKRFLVHKVDRSVTGLCAQQQCVGPLQLPLANVGVTAHSHFGTTGTAVACGEQPIKGLIDAAAMARMTVAEAMTNLMWAQWSKIEDIKASGNWMYAAKLAGEGAKMYDACEALRDSLVTLGVGIDGGKDSLSMAARCGDEVVKAPGELTMTCYVTCPDITKTITPDLKCPQGGSNLLMVDLGHGKARLGGSALAQVYNQVGNVSPDVEDFALFKKSIIVAQKLMDECKILSGHDRSDGGLAVTLLEMAFAGNCGITVDLPASDNSTLETLYAEEAGFVMEVATGEVEGVVAAFKEVGITAIDIGSVVTDKNIKICIDGEVCIEDSMTKLRDVWEATSFHLEHRQRNPKCVIQEEEGLKNRKAPEWKLTYEPKATPESVMDMDASKKHKVAILRQEGSNGDREMISAFLTAGFEAWDVTVSDLLGGGVTLDQFRGIVFVGGFSFADVLDSGKGWAGVIKFNESVFEQFQKFRNRKDTFSLGVCNGCQLMALLGWIPSPEGALDETRQPRLLHNDSGRFESRFSSVQIQASPAIMFKGMEGSSLGVWVAHGEGRFHFPDPTVLDSVKKDNLAPVRYVDDSNNITQEYPFNPNGSPDGIAALCSDDGRHLAMMPHPERVFTTWQWPWTPSSWSSLEAGPWLQMFQNARLFCDEQ